jgi:hypothetical protein
MTVNMKRREFIARLAGTAAAWPRFAAEGARAPDLKRPRVAPIPKGS